MFFADSVGGLGTPAKIGLHGVMLFVVAAVLFFAFAHSVYAVTWDNGGGDGLWSTCTNWTTDACPSASVIATFDSTSTANVAIDANISVIGIDINSGYTGTITQNSGVTVTVGASDFDISDGTFTGGNAAMTVNDAFTVSGGIFTATTATLTVTGAFTVSSGTFNESTGTVAATAGTSAVWNVVTSEQFNNLTINKTGSANVTITSGDTLVVTGTLTLTDGNVNTGTVDTRGAISQASTFDGGTAVIDFGDDSGADTYTINGGIAPNIRFDSSADASDSLTFAAAGTVTSLSITSGFSGTIPISNGSNFTLTFTTWTQDAGTIDASAQSAWTFGTFTISAGSFTAPTTTTAGQNSNIIWNVATSQTFNNFTISKSNVNSFTITSGDTLVVTGTLTLTEGAVNTGTIDARGAISQASTFDGGTAVIDFGDDSGADTYTINGGIAPTIRFDSSADASDSLTFAAAGTVTSLSITSGFSGTIPISNGSNFTLTFTTWTQDAGTIDASAQSAWNLGTFTRSAGSFTAPTTVTSNGNNVTWNVPTSQTFNNLTRSGGNATTLTITSGDTLVVTGTLTLTEGTVGTGTIDARGAISQASTFDGGTAVIDFGDDSGADTYTINGGIAPTIRFDSSADASDSLTFAAAGTVTSLSITSGFSGTIPISNGSNFTLTFTTWTQDAGTIDASAQSAWTVGTFTRSAGSFTAPTTVTSNGNNVTWNVPTSQTFNNLTRSGGNATTLTITSGDTLVVTGTLTLTEGAVGTGTLEAQGGVTVGSGYDGGNSPLTFSGSATQSFDLTGATGLYNSDISVNKSGGQVNLASALVMDAANQDLTIIEGKLYTGGNNLTVNGTSGTFTVQDGGNFQLQGAETITLNASNPTLDTGSTVTYVGNGNAGANTYTITTLKSTYHHLVINSTDGATDVYQLGAALDVNGDLTITAGNLDVVSGSNRAITLAGNWSNSGTFSAQAGTVTLDGTDQSVSGTTSFFNFTKTVATAATLTFAASATQTFTGTLTLQGNSTTDRLALRSSSSPTRAIIDPQSTRTVDFLDVKDINNTNATAITCETPNCFDSGNNLNWNFGGVAQTLSFSISDNTIGFGALSPSAARYATGDTNGSSSDTADAHTLSASTNAGSGYVITVNGATLTHTGNPSYTVTAIGSSATASSAGTEQFGMRLAVNSGSGSATSPYASANWALDTAAFPDQVASGTGDDVTTVYGVRYIGNITTATEAGNYSATLTYTITATF